MSQRYDLHSEFDINLHKKTFVNYLEVIITAGGIVKYAVPSHQEALIKEIQNMYNCSRNDVNDMCPKEYYLDFLNWLCIKSNCISVWNNLYYGTPNSEQLQKLTELKLAGLYTGKI